MVIGHFMRKLYYKKLLGKRSLPLSFGSQVPSNLENMISFTPSAPKKLYSPTSEHFPIKQKKISTKHDEIRLIEPPTVNQA